MLDEVWPFLRATPGLWTEGHNVMLYRNGIPGVEVAVEVGVQVTGSFEPAGRVVPSILPRRGGGDDGSIRERWRRSARRTTRFGRGALATAAS